MMPPMVKIPKRSDMYQPPQTKNKNFQPPPVPPKLNTGSEWVRIQATVVRSDEAKAFFVHILFQSPGAAKPAGLAGVQPTGNGKSPGNDRCVLLATRKNGGSGEKSNLLRIEKSRSPNGMACARSLSHRNHPEPNGCRKRAPRPPVPIPRYPRSRTEISQIWWSDVSKQVSHKPWYLDGETKNIKKPASIKGYSDLLYPKKSCCAPGPPRACWTSLELLLWAR